jgi:hypothetical protein
MVLRPWKLGEVQDMVESSIGRGKRLGRGVDSNLAVNNVKDMSDSIGGPCAAVDGNEEASRLEDGKDGDDVEGPVSRYEEHRRALPHAEPP